MTSPQSNATWFAIRHVRQRQFRWMSLIELVIRGTLVLGACFVLAIVVLIVTIMTGGLTLAVALGIVLLPVDKASANRSGTLFGVWLLDYWQELHIEERGGDGALLSVEVLRPDTADERDQWIARTLDRAAEQGKMVREGVGGYAQGGGELWYGAMPFFVPPREEPTERLMDRVGAHDVRVDRQQGAVVLTYERTLGPRWAGALQLIVAPVFFALNKIGTFGASNGPSWGDMTHAPLDQFLGRGPEVRTVTIRGGTGASVAIREERTGRVLRDITVPGRDLMGVTTAATLRFDRGAMTSEGQPALLTRRTRVPLPAMGPKELQSSLAALVSALIAQEMAGALSLTERPLSCPYCGTAYRMQEHDRCPSCGHGADPAKAV